ncbi:MAG: methyltransferase domain-containing protein [Rhodoferax sp.]|nr:methyltransferase domain-containing protein [Rhodoferax sp.]
MADRPVSDTWESGDPYEQYVGRWSRRVAPLFLDWLAVAPGRRWLDLGCGTGALSAAVLDHAAPSSVHGVEPSDGFRATAQRNLGDRVQLHAGDALSIPLSDASVDVVVSSLVLNFVPDPRAALAEMARVTGVGGTLAAYVWDYAGRMELMRHFWDAAIAQDPAATALDEGMRFPLCRADALEALFANAGLRQVLVAPIDISTPFVDFDDYWQPFLGGQGPAPAYAMSLAPADRSALREAIRARLPTSSDGRIGLVARAWAVRGTVA